eukprot:Seg14677.1 transcript_id=Seg14677.1/GoldUCD/mRNA.D3Y31 product="Spermatogenesis-associated protein 20" protein_id=Seg14677.1/GoldUCD/D3Y31
MPTASSIAVQEFLKLHEITGDQAFEKVAEMTLKAHGEDLSHYPTSLTFMLIGVVDHYAEKQRIVIVQGEDKIDAFIHAVHQQWLPNLTVLGNKGNVDAFPKTLKAIDGKATAYFCEGEACQAPINDVKILEKMLKK